MRGAALLAAQEQQAAEAGAWGTGARSGFWTT